MSREWSETIRSGLAASSDRATASHRATERDAVTEPTGKLRSTEHLLKNVANVTGQMGIARGAGQLKVRGSPGTKSPAVHQAKSR